MKAAERRQEVAHGVSRGTRFDGHDHSPGRGDRGGAGVSAAPPGLRQLRVALPFHGLRRGLLSAGPPGLWKGHSDLYCRQRSN